jgi:Pyruvate/2-oxoacid:ferredoxin oxidoreductase delta subunit
MNILLRPNIQGRRCMELVTQCLLYCPVAAFAILHTSLALILIDYSRRAFCDVNRVTRYTVQSIEIILPKI